MEAEARMRRDSMERMSLTSAERARLLALARAAVEGCVAGTPQVSPRELEAAEAGPLAAARGAFVTLRKRGRLRGCIGYVEPRTSLASAVVENARHAARSDPRFPAVTPDELPELSIEISALTPLVPLRRPEEVVVGRHGLLVSQGGLRGLLLPQVATEHGLDAEQFLGETCRKAGLPRDAWRQGAQVSTFEAEVFGEESSPGEGDRP